MPMRDCIITVSSSKIPILWLLWRFGNSMLLVYLATETPTFLLKPIKMLDKYTNTSSV